MNVWLMHPAEDFEWPLAPDVRSRTLAHDVGLEAVFDTMAQGDDAIRQMVERAMARLAPDPATVHYRQAVLQDVLAQRAWLQEAYAIAQEALAIRKQSFFGVFTRHPTTTLRESAGLLADLSDTMRRLKHITTAHASEFTSSGLHQFAARLASELSDSYLTRVEAQIAVLQNRQGYLFSATLNERLESQGFTLRRPVKPRRGWVQRVWRDGAQGYTFHIADRDEAGFRALAALEDRAVDDVAQTVSAAAQHVFAFFAQLRAELAFYVGAVTLWDHLLDTNHPVCFPEPLAASEDTVRIEGLQDIGLVLTSPDVVVGNDVAHTNLHLGIITGANQGGKSTFLRSVACAQVMMQAGLFVTARRYQSPVVGAVFSHFKREEDAQMQSGKLDEELARMSDIIDHIKPGDLLIMNESLAATNEREGSDVADEIVQSLVDQGVTVLFVTHLHAFANRWFQRQRDDVLFLRAERLDDGSRTFKLIPGPPLRTSFGVDLYRQIFGTPAPEL